MYRVYDGGSIWSTLFYPTLNMIHANLSRVQDANASCLVLVMLHRKTYSLSIVYDIVWPKI